jgi:sucrose phosphorylase
LHAVTFGQSRYLNQWMMSMPPAQDGTAYLNFVTSHDGIGLRPAEGILPESELLSMIDVMKAKGGLVSVREMAGKLVPYELNISLYSACASEANDAGSQVDKFLLIHALMFGLEGVPAVYFPSLFATPNASERVEGTGHNRAINRPTWTARGIDEVLKIDGVQRQVLAGLKRLLRVRRAQPAFHPNATQFTMHVGDTLFAFWRQSRQREQSIFCLHNLTERDQTVPLSQLNLIAGEAWVDLISGEALDEYDKVLHFRPYQSRWISNLMPAGLTG